MAQVIDLSAPGIKLTDEQSYPFREKVAHLLNRNQKGFPGAQPVSFARRHIEELKKQDYYVCEKSDGQRYLLFCTEDPNSGEESHFLIDRRNEYWYVKGLHFPVKDDPKFVKFHLDTLIDGELVHDRSPSGELRAKYLVFDCLILDRKPLMNRTLDKRLAYFKDWMFQPYQELLRRFPEELPYMPFVVELKQMQFPYGMEMMFRQVLPNLPHGNDGLIFTCRNTDYKHGTDQHILKWKSENENSVDFVMQLDFPSVQPDAQDRAEGVTEPWLDYDAIPTVNLMVWAGDREGNRWYGTMHLEPEEWEKLKALAEPLDDRVVECYMDENRRWRFMRFRDDKDKANHISTVESVIESIMDRVTENDLIGSSKAIRDEWKRRQKEEEDRRRTGSGGQQPGSSGPSPGMPRREI